MALGKEHINCFSRIFRNSVLSLCLLVMTPKAFSQHKLRYDNDHAATMAFGAGKNRDGFGISLSLVAMFTAGAADRNGFRLGAGLTLWQRVGNWTFSAGADAYKAKQDFGVGTSFAGLNYDDGRYGASYYLNKYHQGDKQLSGLLGVRLGDFNINFEDDILAFPFAGFKIYDRYRTAALEVRYKGFLAGTNVYTTDIDARTDVSPDNSLGVYAKGRQVSSPVYVGYTTRDLIVRYGFNSPVGGFLGQNLWHRVFFNTPDFRTGSSSNHFIQAGVDKPYTLY
ncbi:hypothetical protein M2132_001347 [Dysgonomonas sp. PH5-45]|uniref:polymorphic toxin type 23 domain-containing protein n=1 Tax=unclassified Dysgonomonas TaxID=2630389 RepID=UPI0024741F06|nr:MULTISPECIES: polymorphic toxin type 23 domain-containing protein [unclassified Dysgonomonas]MDH6355010.1 hypothetical protein [Dysgonomonas sp. PH5-45]MDH6387865.1 hypothetical protein [Dysgonomonas sp. PH5-37]